jgi:hypothetical protein
MIEFCLLVNVGLLSASSFDVDQPINEEDEEGEMKLLRLKVTAVSTDDEASRHSQN